MPSNELLIDGSQNWDADLNESVAAEVGHSLANVQIPQQAVFQTSAFSSLEPTVPEFEESMWI